MKESIGQNCVYQVDDNLCFFSGVDTRNALMLRDFQSVAHCYKRLQEMLASA